MNRIGKRGVRMTPPRCFPLLWRKSGPNRFKRLCGEWETGPTAYVLSVSRLHRVTVGLRQSAPLVPARNRAVAITLIEARISSPPNLISRESNFAAKEIQAEFFNGVPFTSLTPSNTKFTMVFKVDGKVTRKPQEKTGVARGARQGSPQRQTSDQSGLDPACDEPSCQPEPVAPGLVCQHHPADRLPGLHRLSAPTVDQAQDSRCVWLQLLQWLALDAGHRPAKQPALRAHMS